MNGVGTSLEAEGVFRVEAKKVAEHHIADVAAVDFAAILLHKLVADRRRKGHEAVEIIEQLELIADQIGIGKEPPGIGCRSIFAGKL